MSVGQASNYTIINFTWFQKVTMVLKTMYLFYSDKGQVSWSCLHICFLVVFRFLVSKSNWWTVICIYTLNQESVWLSYIWIVYIYCISAMVSWRCRLNSDYLFWKIHFVRVLKSSMKYQNKDSLPHLHQNVNGFITKFYPEVHEICGKISKYVAKKSYTESNAVT